MLLVQRNTNSGCFDHANAASILQILMLQMLVFHLFMLVQISIKYTRKFSGSANGRVVSANSTAIALADFLQLQVVL